MTSKIKSRGTAKDEKQKATTKRKPAIEKSYLAALKEYWEGRPMTSIERLSKLLSDEKTGTNLSFKLYRLWIDILADQHDSTALRDLGSHLEKRAQNVTVQSQTFWALRGLIFFERDEFDAAGLLLSSISAKNNPYVVELTSLLQERTASQPSVSALWGMREGLTDYFHLQTLVRSLIGNKNKLKLGWVMERIKSCFKGSPLPELFDVHGALDKQDFSTAYTPAVKLSERFPGNAEFRFHLGYIAANLGQYEIAIKQLAMANELTEQGDPDILNWLGFSLSESALIEGNKHNLEEALKVLETSIELSVQQGVPTEFPSQQMLKIEKLVGGPIKSGENGPVGYWLIKLNAQKYLELKNSDLKQVSSIRKAMGDAPKPGDLCIVVGQDYSEGEEGAVRLRIGALYLVRSEPMRHPLYQFQSTMSLLCRPDVSIPFEAEIMDGSGIDEDKEQVYAIPPEAITMIENSINELWGEDNPITHVFKEHKLSLQG